jgi:hypothetical protein
VDCRVKRGNDETEKRLRAEQETKSYANVAG